MKINTVKGTNDYLPQEVALRDYLQNAILEVYEANGFTRIMTPVIEDIENLDKSEGGDNLNLIFKILKRGDKLDAALEDKIPGELCDMGLRYDLTLPLSRYYANNRNKLIIPFKCIQIDKVYRAERPQKGRLREFMQCDIDIIGSDSRNSEIELITVTAKALLNIGLSDFSVRINDRGILNDLLIVLDFKESELPSVCITFDKLDKIGVSGVEEELKEKGYDEQCIAGSVEVLSNLPLTLDYVKTKVTDAAKIENIEKIITSVKILSGGKFDIIFDLSLVRGQGYYTGTVFEIISKDFKGAIAGGGRYDNLIGKFIDESVPAVGFSIGFERIFGILKDNGFKIPRCKERIAVIYEGSKVIEANELREELCRKYDVALFEKPKKLAKFLDTLQNVGYYGFIVYGQSDEVKPFRA